MLESVNIKTNKGTNMKTLLTLLVLTLSLSTNAASLTCKNIEGYVTQNMEVKVEISGEFDVLSENDVEFSTLTIHYIIDEEENGYSWSEGSVTNTNFGNNSDYNPRKYFGHMKFSTGVGYDGTEFDGYGYLDFIIPAKQLLAQKKSNFNSYLIMTAMDDHFGGTVKLNCSIK